MQTKSVVHTGIDRARLKDGVHIELSRRRVRTYFGGKLIADSERALLVYETKRPPAYWFPTADVHIEYLDQRNSSNYVSRTTRIRVSADTVIVVYTPPSWPGSCSFVFASRAIFELVNGNVITAIVMALAAVSSIWYADWASRHWRTRRGGGRGA